MQTTDADLDNVLTYIAPKIDFESEARFEQNADDLTDLLIDLKMSFESLRAVLNFYETGDYIKDLVITQNGYSFRPWIGLYDLSEEGGFEAMEKRGQ